MSPCRATQAYRTYRVTQGEWVMMESSDKTWCDGEGNATPLQDSCLENLMNSMKRQKGRTLKDELPRSVGPQYATREEQKNSPRRNEKAESKRNNAQLWMCLVVKVKSGAIKNNTA